MPSSSASSNSRTNSSSAQAGLSGSNGVSGRIAGLEGGASVGSVGLTSGGSRSPTNRIGRAETGRASRNAEAANADSEARGGIGESEDVGGSSTTSSSFGVDAFSSATRTRSASDAPSSGHNGVTGLIGSMGASVLGAAVGMATGDSEASSAASEVYFAQQQATASAASGPVDHVSTAQVSSHVNADGSRQDEVQSQTMGPDGLIKEQIRTLTSAPDENGVVHVSKEGSSMHPDGTVTSFVERSSTLVDENGNSVTSSVRQDRTPEGLTESRLSTLQSMQDGVVNTMVQGTITGPDGVTRDVNFADSHALTRESAQGVTTSNSVSNSMSNSQGSIGAELSSNSVGTHGSTGSELGYSSAAGLSSLREVEMSYSSATSTHLGSIDTGASNTRLSNAEFSAELTARAVYSEQVAASVEAMAARGLSQDQLEAISSDLSAASSDRTAASAVLERLDAGVPLDQAYAQASAEARAVSEELFALSTATADMTFSSGAQDGLQSLADRGLTRSDLMAIASDENASSAQKEAAAEVLAVMEATSSAPEGAAEVGLQSARQEAGELAHALADASQTLRTKDGVTSEELHTLAQSPDLSAAQATAISMIASEAANNGGGPQAVEAALDKAGQFAENLGALANSRVQVEELPALVAASSPDQALGGVTPADALQTLTQAHTQALAAELPSALEALADAKPDYTKLKELAQDSTAAPDQQLAAQTVLDQLPASAELTGASPEQIQETAVALAAAEQQAEADRVAGVIEAMQFSEHVATADEAETSSKQAEQEAMSME